MARLPFDQTRLQSPQFNRVSAVAAPRVQPIDVTSEAAFAKMKTFEALGTAAFNLGQTIVSIYGKQEQNRKKEEKRQQYLSAGNDMAYEVGSILNQWQQDPPQDRMEAISRWNQFAYGVADYDGTQKLSKPESKEEPTPLVLQLMEKHGLSKKEVLEMMGKVEVEALLDLEALGLRQESQARVFDATQQFNQGLLGFGEGIDFETFEDKNALLTAIDTNLQDVLARSTEALRGSERNKFLSSAQDSIFRFKTETLNGYAEHLLDKNTAAYKFRQQQILSTLGVSREEQKEQLALNINEAVENNVLDAEGAIAAMMAAEESLDLANANNLVATNPQGFLELLLESAEKKENPFPGLNALQIENLRQRAQSISSKRLNDSLIQASNQVKTILQNYLNPEVPVAALKSDFQEALRAIPEGIVKQNMTTASGYAETLRSALDTFSEKSNPEIVAAVNGVEKPPPSYVEGEENPVFMLQRKLYADFVKQADAFMKEREKDLPNLFQKKNPNVNPLLEATIQSSFSMQRSVIGDNSTSDMDLFRKGRIKPLPDVVYDKIVTDIDAASSGTEIQSILNTLEAQSGEYFPMIMSQFAKGKVEKGLGLPSSAYLYTDMQDPAIVENFFASEKNAERNREKFSVLVKNMTKVDFENNVRSNEFVSSFIDTINGNSPANAAIRESFVDSIGNYALEMMSRDQELEVSSAIEKAGQQLLDRQYMFLEPSFQGGEGKKVRLPRALMQDFEEGDLEDALSTYVERAIESAPLQIKQSAEDRKWAWFNTPLDDGLQLYVLDEVTQRYQAVGGDPAKITYAQLKDILVTQKMREEAKAQAEAAAEAQKEEEKITREEERKKRREELREEVYAPQPEDETFLRRYGLTKDKRRAAFELTERRMGTGPTLWELLDDPDAPEQYQERLRLRKATAEDAAKRNLQWFLEYVTDEDEPEAGHEEEPQEQTSAAESYKQSDDSVAEFYGTEEEKGTYAYVQSDESDNNSVPQRFLQLQRTLDEVRRMYPASDNSNQYLYYNAQSMMNKNAEKINSMTQKEMDNLTYSITEMIAKFKATKARQEERAEYLKRQQ